MKEIDRAICLELEKALAEAKGEKSFIQILEEIGVLAPTTDPSESSEDTYARVKEHIGEIVPKTPEEALGQIERICKEAVNIYDNEEFYEDDCDRFMGESIMAERVLEVIQKFDAFVGATKLREKQ